MKAAVQMRKNQDNTATNPRAELSSYLAAPLEDGIEDVVGWWGVSIPPFLFDQTSKHVLDA